MLTTSNSIRKAKKSKIILQEFPASFQLKETQLSKMLQVTRTPDRKTIINLERKRIVTIHPNKGASIIKFSKKDIEDILEVDRHLKSESPIWRFKEPAVTTCLRISATLKGREIFLKANKGKHFEFSGVNFITKSQN